MNKAKTGPLSGRESVNVRGKENVPYFHLFPTLLSLRIVLKWWGAWWRGSTRDHTEWKEVPSSRGDVSGTSLTPAWGKVHLSSRNHSPMWKLSYVEVSSRQCRVWPLREGVGGGGRQRLPSLETSSWNRDLVLKASEGCCLSVQCSPWGWLCTRCTWSKC